ncbi:hypothetical protein KFU94_47910 [Chloroflexi bacterium TSY]|nr:hypothetical protein [Chloroflexi bacterium TSY]
MKSLPTKMRLRLLGPIQIEHEGSVIHKLGSQKSLALLGYLVCNPHEQSRAKLAALLWPDQPDSSARGNLRWALNNLSKLLPNCITATRHTLHFQPCSSLWVDTIVFEQHLAEKSQKALSSTLDLYRGEFMEGMLLDDSPDLEMWLLQEREEWRRQVTHYLEELIHYEIDAKRYDQAETYVTRLLNLEPWREEAHRQLMWLLAVTDQRSAALVQFENCSQILATELAIEPSAETVALYEQIRDGEIMGSPRSISVTDEGLSFEQIGNDTRVAEQETKRGIEESPDYPILSPTYDWGEAPLTADFYGRTAEVALLEHWFMVERARLVTIVGMGGMGKTTLASHVSRNLYRQFDCIIWRSLINAPPVSSIVETWVQTLSEQRLLDWPETLDSQIHLLLQHLRMQAANC